MADGERFSFKKLLSGFAFWDGAAFGKIVYYVVICAICIGVFYVLFLKRTEVHVDKPNITAESGSNVTYNSGSTVPKKPFDLFVGAGGGLMNSEDGGDGYFGGLFGGVKW